MPSCKEIAELATSYSEGALDPEARRRFEAHIATCSDCRPWVRQLDIVARAVRLLPPPEVPAELRSELLRRFDAWKASRAGGEAPAPAPSGNDGARRYAWEALLATVGVVALLAGLARNPSNAAEDWGVSAALAAGAIAVAILARRLTIRFAVVAVSAAFVAAAVRGGPGDLAFAEGLECLLIEAAAAAAVASAAWLAARRAPGTVPLGTWAIAGALAGDAALQISCGAHLSMLHLVTFHAGGVLVVAALALVHSWRRPATA
jgi:hypothetical protein